eukprot:3601408-Rhodomonas_salina.2
MTSASSYISTVLCRGAACSSTWPGFKLWTQLSPSSSPTLGVNAGVEAWYHTTSSSSIRRSRHQVASTLTRTTAVVAPPHGVRTGTRVQPSRLHCRLHKVQGQLQRLASALSCIRLSFSLGWPGVEAEISPSPILNVITAARSVSGQRPGQCRACVLQLAVRRRHSTTAELQVYCECLPEY